MGYSDNSYRDTDWCKLIHGYWNARIQGQRDSKVKGYSAISAIQRIRGIEIKESIYKYIQGYRGTWVLEYRDTDYRNIGIQGYRDKPYRIIEIRHTGIQR